MKKVSALVLILVVVIQILTISESNIYSSSIDLPKTPTNVNASATESSITVSWSGVEGASNYDVMINGSVNTTSQTLYTYTGLAQETVYEYSVRAKNDLGSSAYSASKTIKTLKVINVPTGIKGVSAETSVTISWVPVNEATGYEIMSGDMTVLTRLSSFTFNDLSPNTIYSYSVRTIVVDRKSEFSNIINIKTQNTEPITPIEVVEIDSNIEPETEITTDIEEDTNNINQEVIESTEVDLVISQEISSVIAKPIITPEIEFVHSVNTDLDITWINGEGYKPDKFSVELYDDSGYLVFLNIIDGNTFNYLLPKKIFNRTGKYYLEIVGYKENIKSRESQEVIYVLDETIIEVLTKIYDKYTNKSYILKGEIRALNSAQIVEYGFYWGNTIDMDNVLIVNNADDNGEFSMRLPQIEGNQKYYYKAYARKRNGEYVFGEVISIFSKDNERMTAPIIYEVKSDPLDENSNTKKLTIKTDTEVVELLMIDQNGSIIRYKNSFHDVSNLRIWEIVRLYPYEGIYEEVIYAYSMGSKSEGFNLSSLVGIREYNPIETNIEKNEYHYFVRNTKMMTFEGQVYTTNKNDYITSISFCLNGSNEEQDCILYKEVNTKVVDLDQDMFTIDPKKIEKNSTGIYSILIYASTYLNEKLEFLVAEVTINLNESVIFVDMKSEFEVFADESTIQLTGSVISLDNTYIKEVNLITNNIRKNIYKETILSNIHREVIDFNEKIDLVFGRSKFQIIRVLILLSDGSIIRKDIKVYLCMVTMGVPAEVDINKDIYIRIYMTHEDGSRKIIKDYVNISIEETDIAKLIKNKLSTLKEGTIVISAKIDKFDSQIATSQVLNITKKDK